ncbi:hypothetical protein BZZ01_24745 [Nostocales cyanobacterium HT-58-2]|nr:hypothetical protein BZZ01_24745 [Nostocales cyanobacterium HT-58-2]
MFATLIVSWIVFTLLVKVLKTTIKTAFITATAIVLLDAAFGITPQDIWHQIMHIPRNYSPIVRLR